MTDYRADISKRYVLPRTDDEAIRFLSTVLKIPHHYVGADKALSVSAMAATVLYRQLGRHEKIEAMSIIHALPNGYLKGTLIGRCTDALVNPQWAEWSLTNQELEEIVKFHAECNRWSSIAGANPGAYGIGASVWSIIKNNVSSGNLSGLVASLVLVGIHEFSNSEMQRYGQEVERRKVYVGHQP